MAFKITVSSGNLRLYRILQSDLPEGVEIVSPPPKETRDWGTAYSADINIEIVVDISVIAKVAFATWLIRACTKRPRGNEKINVNGKQISVNDPRAIEFVTKEIEDK